MLNQCHAVKENRRGRASPNPARKNKVKHSNSFFKVSFAFSKLSLSVPVYSLFEAAYKQTQREQGELQISSVAVVACKEQNRSACAIKDIRETYLHLPNNFKKTVFVSSIAEEAGNSPPAIRLQ